MQLTAPSVDVRSAGRGGGALRRRSSRRRRDRLIGLAFTTPAWILLVLAIVVPLVVAVATSLTDNNLSVTTPPRFVGGSNYSEQVFTGGFGSSLIVTVAIIVCSLVVQLPLGFVLALLLVRPFRGRWSVRAAVTIPMMLTPVAVGLMWRFLADPDLGVIRWIAAAFEHDAHPNLFASRIGALALIVFVNSWINVPFVTLLLMAGLVAIPTEIEEAASMDGANRWQIVRHVVIPMLVPVLLVVSLLRVAADYRMFDLVYVITQGGPGDATQNLSMLAYQQGLTYFQIGRACAIGIAMAVLALPAYALYAKVTRP